MNRPRTRWARPSLALLLAVATVAAAAGDTSCTKAPGADVQYHCPMHPTYVSDHPGDCPICGMRLVPFEKAAPSPSAPAGSAASPASAAATAQWTCPMDPEVVSDKPGKCPKCGMDLVPKVPAPAVPGLATVETTGEGRRLAGVQTIEARHEHIARTVRAVGTVVVDETRVRHVHTRVAGWVDHLFVDFTGQAVRKGAPILTLYSPELLATQEEYLQALGAAKRFRDSSLPEVRKGGEDLVRAARRRLELFDVPRGFIDDLERTGTPRRNVPMLAPSSGFVTAKDVFEGQQVEPNMELFAVTDLSRVWIEADLHEDEAGLVRTGDEAVVTLVAAPGVPRTGKVAYVAPVLSPDTRTLKVRFDFANGDGALKPAMNANVLMTLQAGDGVVVPDTAVMDTGLRQVVFVAGPNGAFEPRSVKVGLRNDGRALVLEGLKEGERVAVAANFLLDSESRLRAALEGPP